MDLIHLTTGEMLNNTAADSYGTIKFHISPEINMTCNNIVFATLEMVTALFPNTE